MIKITIGPNDGGQRLDKFLKKYMRNAGLSHIYKIIRKDLKVNGRRGTNDTRLEAGDELTFYLTQETFDYYTARPENKKAKRQFEIAYEDDQVLIVNKPYGLLTHGDKSEKKNHLANQVIDYLIETGAYNPRQEHSFVPAPSNRLDRNTTGLVIFGKTAEAVRELNRRLRTHDGIHKYYLAMVSGNLTETLTLRNAMTRDEKQLKAIVSDLPTVDCDSTGSDYADCGDLPETDPQNLQSAATGTEASQNRLKEMLTIVKPLEHNRQCGKMPAHAGAAPTSSATASGAAPTSSATASGAAPTSSATAPGAATLVEAEIFTGRFHQIRAQLAAAGYPLIGDSKYAGYKAAEAVRRKYGITTQQLHAYKLQFDEVDGPLAGLAGKAIEVEWPEGFAESYRKIFG